MTISSFLIHSLALCLLMLLLVACGGLPPEESGPTAAAVDDSKQTHSDDAQTAEEESFHANARALVISYVEPNKLGVGGREFRVKRNPVGEGCFVYDPRTRFHGVERPLVWWVPKEGAAYALNSPAKMVTPRLRWPREAGLDLSTPAAVDYVFSGKPMNPPIISGKTPGSETFTVNEYRLFRAIMKTPMSVSEDEAFQITAKRYGVSAQEVRKATDRVQKILFQNGWIGAPDSEIRHASDWNGEKP